MQQGHKSFDDMSIPEFQEWLADTITKLERKKQRELNYLRSDVGRKKHRVNGKLHKEQELLCQVIEFLKVVQEESLEEEPGQ